MDTKTIQEKTNMNHEESEEKVCDLKAGALYVKTGTPSF